MAKVIKVNHVIPGRHSGATPALVVFDNGDYNIAMEGDVGYIKDTAPAFVGGASFIDLFNELLLLNDYDEIIGDEAGVTLSIEFSVTLGAPEEHVVAVWDDGTMEVMIRYDAQHLVESDETMINFIPFVEVFEELRDYVLYNRNYIEEAISAADAFPENEDEDEDRD